MRLSLENLIVVISLVLTEAWFLHGYFAGKPEFEPLILFLVAFGAVFAKDKIKERFGFGADVKNHDRTLFTELQRVLPAEPTLRLLKEQDFGGSFPKRAIQPLHEFVETWDSVNKEFFDKKLEKERKALYSAAKDLALELGMRTIPVDGGEYLSVLREDQRGGPRPSSVLEDAKALNKRASEFVPKYEAFIRLCKGKLAS
jgi:hypothetical protein